MLRVALKAFIPLIFAVFIDGLQALLSIALLGVTGPIGIVLGFVVTVGISLTFGVGLLLIMGLEGMLSLQAVALFTFGEMIPVFNDLPLWTGMVLWCSFKALQKEDGAAGALASVAGAVLQPSASSITSAIRRVDGIRSAPGK